MYRGANDGTPRRVLLDVVERVLRDVADARVRVLPDRARRGLDLARQALDERRFTSTIGTYQSENLPTRQFEVNASNTWTRGRRPRPKSTGATHRITKGRGLEFQHGLRPAVGPVLHGVAVNTHNSSHDAT